MSEKTPLMKQYTDIKSQYQDAILLFRVGDFYETFYDDAKTISRELGLTLTKRNKEKGIEIPLAGVPFHSIASYISKLIQKGYTVAICDQVEAPKDAVGIVKREVTRVITPGTVIDTSFLEENKNNYLLSLCIEDKKNIASICYADITTGEFVVSDLRAKNSKELLFKILGELNKISPSEILLDTKTYENFHEDICKYFSMLDLSIKNIPKPRGAEDFLKKYFNVVSLSTYNLKENVMMNAVACLLKYVIDLQKDNDIPLKNITYKKLDKFMELNITTQNNLDLFPKKNLDSKGTLLGILDECKTSMGSRLLKNIIKNPLLDKKKIEERYALIDYFFSKVLLRDEIRNILKDVYDIERIAGKLILGTENAKDLLALKYSLKKSLEILELLAQEKLFENFSLDKEKILKIHNYIENTILEDAPFSVRDGGMIKSGLSQELDELRKISSQGKNYILDLELREKEKTGIKGLKIKFNKVFGYFIEVTKANAHLVPETYIRKQTLVNCERYIVQELKEYEDKVMGAKAKIESLEYEIFKEISRNLKENKDFISQLAEKLAFLDVITNFAHISIKNNYVRPKLIEGYELKIEGARHPVVEKLINEAYIENDVFFDAETRLIILTGPNMSGKSTYMKQIALNIIMAQIGCFVPAKNAELPIVDKIFTRIGASDDLISGQSTFMLEMTEVANIVNSATKNSFIILDEVGRGTSTYDGISIATAITEYIHNNIEAKTIFATHYHELTELEKELTGAVNFRVEVKENGKEVLFLRKIVKGGADRSYGIEVAKLSGLPNTILNRANKILHKLEKRKSIIDEKIKSQQMMLFSDFFEAEDEKEEEVISEEENYVLEELRDLDTDSLSPIEALLKLHELKKKLNK